MNVFFSEDLYIKKNETPITNTLTADLKRAPPSDTPSCNTTIHSGLTR
jgi:hypothetical protein